MAKLEEYFQGIISNTAFIRWKDVSEALVGPSIAEIRKKLEKYPNFEFISPMHYGENNILKLTIEGSHGKPNTDCEAFEPLTRYNKLIMRLLFRWMFNYRFSDIISKRFQLQDFGLDCYKIQSVSSIVRFMTDFNECLKNDFFRILHKLSLPRQIIAIEEIMKILSSKTTEADLRELTYLSYSDVHLNEMKYDFKEVLKPSMFSEFIDDVVNSRLFSLGDVHDKEIEERKEKLFGNGLEVLRFRVDNGSGGKVPQAGLVKGVCYLETADDYDFFVLMGKTYKKYSLFKCLFNRNRHSNGFRLVFDDMAEPKYGGNNEGEIIPMDDKTLQERPLALRIIYKTLYSSKFNLRPVDKYSDSMNDLAFSLFENKEVLLMDQDNITCIATHHKFPVIFAACKNGDILVVWSQTMRVISYLYGARNNMTKIVISPSGDRVVGIDSHSNIIVWRFNLLQKKLHVEGYIKNSSTIDLCFVNDSSLFAVLTKDGVLLEDLLPGSTLNSTQVTETTGNWIFFLPLSQRCLIVNAKKRSLSVIDVITKANINDATLETTTAEITTCITNRLGTIVALGTQDGEVILVNTKTLEPVVTYHPFESAGIDKKLKAPVSMMNLDDYLVAVSAGGSVSIVTKV